jgi:TusA-related sulfurtransferase
MWQLILLGLPIGLAFGYAVQRGRFCINSAFRDVYLIRDSTLLRAFLLAVLVQMVGVQVLIQAGVVQVWALEFFWLANIVGGLVFGVGMVLAGGCSGGSWYKVGEGQSASMAAVASFAVMAALTEVGFLAPVRLWLQRPSIMRQPDGQGPTLDMVLGLPSPWLMIVPVVILGGIWLARSPRKRTFRGWTWPRTGLAVGLLGIVAVFASWLTGRAYGYGITFSTAHWLRWLVSLDSSLLDWESFFVIGIPLGALVAAWRAGELRWRYPGAPQMARAIAGGGLMGFGAMVMAGCTIGHSLAGTPLLAMSSLVSTVAIVLGTWVAAWMLFGWRSKGAPTNELRSVGEVCPFPLVRAQNALAALGSGEQLSVTFDCMQALESLPRWAERQGHTVVSRQEVDDGVWKLVIQRA